MSIASDGIIGNQHGCATTNFGILSLDKGRVAVDGKVYQVKSVNNNSTMIKSLIPIKQDVVEINGKQYRVQTVPDSMTCDGTRQVVYIDGKLYPVSKNGGAELQALGQQILNKVV